MNEQQIRDLKIHATHVRKMALEAVYSAGSGHPGGSLSAADILTYLYLKEMKVDPKDPKNPDRDRFVLSKGHCSPALYGVLAEAGFIPKEDIKTFRSADSYLQGHPDMKGVCDGESEEGQVWEAAMFAAHYKLDNLTAFMDFNGLQIDGEVTKVMNPTPLDDKFEAFGWHIIRIDAHDFSQIESAVEEAKSVKGKPTLVLAKSVKGKGVSFMENQAGWHGAAPNKEQYEQAISELDAYLNELGGAAK